MDSSIVRIVILAAGQGKRLLPLTTEVPKALLDIGGKTLIERQIGPDAIERAFDEAVDTNGWLIFYSHDVVTEPSPYGCSPSLLRHALEAASRRKIANLSIADALRTAGA